MYHLLNMEEITVEGEKYTIPNYVKERYEEDQQFRELLLLVLYSKAMDQEEKQFRIDSFGFIVLPEEEKKLYDILQKERMSFIQLDLKHVYLKNDSFEDLIKRSISPNNYGYS